MSALLHLMVKSLVIPYYKSHAGLLFFVFFLMFGIVESTQIVFYHTSLIYGMLSSGMFLILVFAIWLLYQLKTLHFLIKTIDEDAYLFFHHLSLLPARKTFFLFMQINIITFLPVFIYTIAIYVIGIENKFYDSLTIIFIFQLTLWLLNAGVLNYLLRNQHKKSRFSIPSFTLPYQQTQMGMYVGYLFKEEKSAILISKLFSLVLLYIVKDTLVAGDDFRIISITWLFALLSHTFLIQKLKTFEDHSLLWIRNLPISIGQTYAMYLILYFLLMIPELILLTGTLGRGLSVEELFLLPLFAGSFLTTIHCYLNKPDRDPDKFVTYLFWLFIICFMLVLSKFIWITTIVLLVISFLQLQNRFFRYEPKH